MRGQDIAGARPIHPLVQKLSSARRVTMTKGRSLPGYVGGCGMSSQVRISLLAVVACVAMAITAPAAQAAFGVESFYSLTCTENEPEGEPGECNPGTPEQFFTQAGGHPDFRITDFT